MSELVKMTCIGCPLGCQLDVAHTEPGGWKIDGYECKKGKTYAVQEATDPRRMLTTTVAIEGGIWRRLPVRSAEAVPKAEQHAICRELHRLKLQAPVALGQVVLADAADTGIDIIATRSMPVAGPPAHRL